MGTSPAITANHHADYPGFAGISGLLFGLVMAVLGRAKARLVVDLAAVSDADRIVDIGCGPGTAARAAARRGAQVTGVDPAPVMLRIARRWTRDPRITWAEGAAEKIPVQDGSATVVWTLASVHHWRDVDAGVREAHRVLLSGGRFLAIERQVRPGATGLATHGWTEQQTESFVACCRACGFDGIRTEAHGTGRGAVWVISAVRP
ncbi:class I SAM-dependent methyltransferase [Nocardia sp. NPDC052112]|uniref:class I SAM-dependent methyltransferase n=1 Tax=Nocardia sp. NPDC052112 TaxID=3155646 RepID=UPI0034302973